MVNYGELVNIPSLHGSSPRDTATRFLIRTWPECSTEHPKLRPSNARPFCVFLQCWWSLGLQGGWGAILMDDRQDGHSESRRNCVSTFDLRPSPCMDARMKSAAHLLCRGHGGHGPRFFNTCSPPRPPWNKPGRKPSKRERQNIWGPLWEPPRIALGISYWILWLEITWP